MLTGILLEDALAIMEQSVTPLGAETLPPMDALGRTLARNVTAPMSCPPFHRSPLDGYALCAADSLGASRQHPVTLRVANTVYAGDVPTVSVASGLAVRIMTGAMLPHGCDCVLRQEDTNQGFPEVEIYQSLKPYANYCYRGEDFQAGDTLLTTGTRVDAAAAGVLASAGITSVTVCCRPTVGILTTGDEVVPPSTHPLPAGKIYGANQNLLMARLRELGITAVCARHAGDAPHAVADAMAELLERCDAIITTGGVSVGDKDILHGALPLLGAERHFWRVLLKPGTPLMFSTYRGKPILSLSGNPFAAAATFELLARPLLATLSGEPALCPVRGTAILDSPFLKGSPSRRFLRATYKNGHVTLPEAHSSGVLSSLVGCNCLVDAPAGAAPLEVGAAVSILLL